MKEFIIRGKTADFKVTGDTHVINFGGHKGDYGFKLIEFQLYSSEGIGATPDEMCGAITAGKTAADPEAPNFEDEGLIATSMLNNGGDEKYGPFLATVINDTFIITQDLILTVTDNQGGSPTNWQCKFLPVKLSSSEAALANYRQFSIFDE